MSADEAKTNDENAGERPDPDPTPPVSETGVWTPTSPPERLGRYEIRERLGGGGMGDVFLAYDAALDRQVALKVPQLSGKNDAQVIERFQREARAAATLDHPNLCAVYDVGEENGQHYLAMAFIEGRPLTEFIQGRTISQRKAAALVAKVALALEQAHQCGVIHRDLKPANIMINDKRQPVVVDFGLARRVEASSKLTNDGVAVGTPAYMSPEQIQADMEGIGPSTDIYSLGVVLYEMIAGRTPFRGDGYAVAAQVAHEPPPPPSTLRADVDSALEQICLRALEKRPEDRFESMDAFAEALKAYLSDPNARFKGQSASTEVADDELPKLAPLEESDLDTSPALETLTEPATKPARPNPVTPPADFTRNSESLTLALAIVAIGYGGFRCLRSIAGLLIGLLSFSLASVIPSAWAALLGALAAYLVYLGLRVFQREEGAAEKASQVALVFLGLLVLGLFASGISTLVMTQSPPSVLGDIEGAPEAFKLQRAEQTRATTLFVGLWMLQLVEFIPLGFILWAERQLRLLRGESVEG